MGSLQETRDSIGSNADKFVIPIRFFRNLNLHQTLRIYSKEIESDILYWDSDIQGNWDEYDWGDDTDNNPTESDLLYVLNQNNTFVDTFDTEDFIDDSNSTGSYSLNEYELNSGEILQSTLIYKNNHIYQKATLTVTGSEIDDDTFYLSGDGGSNWESVTNGTEHTFTNISSGAIKYKIVGGATTSTINKIKIKYR
jgi:hypothetical protein